MMYPRLVLGRELLRDDGVIFISIDDNEAAQLRLLCDEVFGQACFVNQIVVKSSEASGVKMSHVEKRLPKIKEYVACLQPHARRLPFRTRRSAEAIDRCLFEILPFVYRKPRKAADKWRIVSALDAMRTRGLKTDEDWFVRSSSKTPERVVYRTNNPSLAAMGFETKTAEVVGPTASGMFGGKGSKCCFCRTI